MKLVIGFVLGAGFVSFLYWIIVVDNPHDRELDRVRKEAMQAGSEIASAQTILDCEILSSLYLARKSHDAMNQFVLNPDINELLVDGEIKKPALPFEELRDDLKAQFAAIGESGLYMLACLRHLHDEGIIPLDESVARIIGGMKRD